MSGEFEGDHVMNQLTSICHCRSRSAIWRRKLILFGVSGKGIQATNALKIPKTDL